MGIKRWVVLLCLGLTGWTQNGLMAAERTPEPVVRENIANLLDEAWQIRNSNPDSAMLLANTAIELAQSIHDRSGEGRALRMRGIAHKKLANYPDAMDAYMQSIRIFEKLHDSLEIARVKNNIGAIHGLNESHELAAEYFQSALGIFLRHDDKKEVGKSYLLLGNCERGMDNLASASRNYTEAAKIFEEINDLEQAANAFSAIGTINTDLENFEKAKESHLKAIVIRKSLGDKIGLTQSYNSLGVIYQNQELPRAALPYYKKALAIAEETKDLSIQRHIHSNLAYVYASLGNFSDAFDHQSTSQELNETIFSQERDQRIDALTQQYEAEQHQKEIARLELKNQMQKHALERKTLESRQLWIAMTGLVLISLLIYAYTRKRAKDQLQIITNQQEILRLNGLLEDLTEERESLVEQVEKFLNKEPNYAPLKRAVLSATEELIFMAIAQNKTLQQIAVEGELKPEEVAASKKTMFQKMQIRSSEELREMARRLNIVEHKS